jgi:hypothetical protein
MKQVGKNSQDEINIAVINNKLDNLVNSVDEIKKKLESDYVTRAEFTPVQRVVYGLVALLLTGVGGALLALVLRK